MKPNHKQTASDPAFATEYRREVLELRMRLFREPPHRDNFTLTDYPSFLTKDGRHVTVTRLRLLCGIPHFYLDDEDLHDSFWYYPVLRETIIGWPSNVEKAETHTEYHIGRLKRLGLED